MSQGEACTEYFSRISSILYAIENQDKYNSYLNDIDLISSNPHNMQANLLRKGLVITNFCYFEDFIKKRVRECLGSMTSIFSEPGSVPEDLQRRFTVKALEGVLNRVKKLDRKSSGHSWDEVFSFICQETGHISSLEGASYSISGYAFGWDKENISETDISGVFKEFYISDVWRKISVIAQSIDYILLQPKEEFSNIAQTRHKAAHVAGYTITINDLERLVKNTFVLAFSMDYLLTYSVKLLMEGNNEHLQRGYNFLDNRRPYRKIIYSNDKFWKEYYSASIGGRCTRKHRDHDQLFELSKGKLKGSELLVSFSKNQSIRKWFFNFTRD